MRKRAIWFVLAGLALPAFASTRVTVGQLERILANDRAKSDAELAKQLGDLELTERLSSTRLEQLRANLSGERSRNALVAIADFSAFLDPPSTEIPATATPDAGTQRRIMALTVDYLGKTLPLLPNLFAARDTMRYETRPVPQQGIDSADNPLHEVSTSRVTVLYRDGREFVDAGADKNKKAHAPDRGLTTWGEFGPILGTVLIDAARSRLSWSHWELAGGGPQAVFHYSVPREKSHYDLRFCCITESYGFETSVLSERVGYHGEITVDPDSGTILRITVLADIGSGNPISRADIAVEYGPVEIAGNTYFCPARGIAIALGPNLKTMHGDTNPPPSTVSKSSLPTLQKASLTSVAEEPHQTLLNDVAFREYHFFRGEPKILPESGTDPRPALAPKPVAAPETGLATASSASPSPSSGSGATAAPAEEAAAKPVEDTAVDSSTLAPQPIGAVAGSDMPASPVDAVIPEISVRDAGGLPTAPALAQAEGDSAATLRLNARLVDVPLVALDKKGRPITNLKPEDLEIYDEGHKVEVRSFVQAGSAQSGSAAPQTAHAPVSTSPAEGAGPATQHAFSNQALAAAKTASSLAQGNTIILLLDNTLSFDDLSNVREQMRTFLNRVAEDQRIALYVMRVGGFQILHDATTDHALLSATLAKWTPSAQNISLGQEQEARNRQTMEYVHSPEDLLNVNGLSQSDSGPNTEALDPKLRTLGDNPGRDALSGMFIIARHLGSVPGHKSLVWIASDNTLADWTSGSLNIDKGDRIIQSSVLRAQEAMNDAHVSVYPLDASRLEAGGIDASIGTRNVELTPTYQRPPAQEHQLEGPEATAGPDLNIDQGHALNPGRAIAQMQQDTHSIQGAYREIADATGGRVFRRASDMVSEFNSVVADGRATYLLSFTPAQAADGKYHLISVKIAGRKDVKLQYRTGFFYREEPSTIKDRFSQTVLEPEDATGIALSADPLPGSNGHTVKLGIAATDLAIAQKDAFWTDKLDVYVVQREVSGTKAHVTGQTMGLRLKPATYQQYLREGIPFNQVVEAAPGVGSVRIVVVDENSGRMGSVTIPATAIGKAQ